MSETLEFIIVVFIGLIVLGGATALQIYLSLRKSALWGLIMPAFCFGLSIFVVSGLTSYLIVNHSSISHSADYEIADGSESEYYYEPANPANSANPAETSNPFPGIAGVMFPVVFVIFNVPTAVFLIAYFICRQKVKEKSAVKLQIKEIEKMNIQDL